MSVCMRNYKRDGTAFWNLFLLAPVPDATGAVAWYLGVQSEVSAEVAAAADADAGACVPGVREARGADPVQEHNAERLAAELRAARGGCGGGGTKPAPPAGAADSAAAAAASEPLSLLVPPCPPAPAASGVSPTPGHPGTAASVPCSLLRALQRVHHAFCLADPRLPDCPIVHASDAYLALTGHSAAEVLGRNCRFLQARAASEAKRSESGVAGGGRGRARPNPPHPAAALSPAPPCPPQGPGTDPAAVAALRAGIAAGVPTTVRLLNYRKARGGDPLQRVPFWNSVHVSPVRDATGAVALLVGVQVDVTATVLAEQQQLAAAAAATEAGGEGGGGGAPAAGEAPAAARPAADLAPAEAAAPAPQPAAAAVPPAVAQLGVVGAVRVAVRGLKCDQLLRHNSGA